MIKEIRCSGLSRPMTCAGSLFLEGLPDETNEAAEEGTACGELLEHKLLGSKYGTHASNGVLFDEDMKFYSDVVAEEILSDHSTDVLCETRIDWMTKSGITIRGQYDASFIRDGKLYIDDLKYGWGLVEVKENWQLLGYAIGEIIRRGHPYDVVMRIHQPRPHHPEGSIRQWAISYGQLLEYRTKIEKRMSEIMGGERSLVPSNKCKYCPAASTCSALNDSFYRGIDVAHKFLQDDITDKELSFQLDLISRIQEIVKIKKTSLEELAQHRIKAGGLIPNYISKPSYGHRTWTKNVSPDFIKAMTGKDILEKKLMTPAKAEKLKVPKELIEQVSERHFKGVKIVREDSTALGNKIFGQGENP